MAFTQLFGYIKPTAQQVIEDTLLDTSKLLAASLQLPLSSGQLYDQTYQAILDTALTSKPTNSMITAGKDIQTTGNRFRIYVTDSNGVVVYDSLTNDQNAEGQDYSRWNDVYLTLNGQYGARSTKDTTNNDGSSIMYVAQPINDTSGNLIGVVSVGKPVASVLPYLNHTRGRMLITALLMSIVALILAGLVAWWLKQSITLVTQYTNALAEDTKKPYFYLGHELNSLTDTIESMKHRLENRAYVTDYVHTLTHELKSPLTAIRASSELLEDDVLDGGALDHADRQMLIQAVSEQSIKMQQLIDRLLLLAKIEQPTFKLNRQITPIVPLLQTLVKDNTAKRQQKNLLPIELYIDDTRYTDVTDLPTTGLPITKSQSQIATNISVFADQFWLVQVLQNVLDNAIHFAENEVIIYLQRHNQSVSINIFNDGKLLPGYALDKVFDRYFSLAHQSQPTQNISEHSSVEAPTLDTEQKPLHTTNTPLKKGTGLGLTLVKQVIEHHGGRVAIRNKHANTKAEDADMDAAVIGQSSGVIVSLTLPLKQT